MAILPSSGNASCLSLGLCCPLSDSKTIDTVALLYLIGEVLVSLSKGIIIFGVPLLLMPMGYLVVPFFSCSVNPFLPTFPSFPHYEG